MYIVDDSIQCEIDERGQEVNVSILYYDAMEIPDFHKNELSPEEIEARQKREEQFRREFDWDSLLVGAPDYDPDLDFLDDFEEDDNI